MADNDLQGNDQTPDPSTAFIDAAGQGGQQGAPPAAPPPAPPTSPPPQEPPAPPADNFSQLAQLAQQAGIATDSYKTPDDLVGGLVNQIQQRNQALAYAQTMLQGQGGKQAPPPQQPPEEPKDEWDIDKHFEQHWQVPQYDPSWETFLRSNIENGLVERTAGGQFRPTPGNEWLNASPQLQAINNYEATKTKPVEDLFYGGNFYRNVYDKLEEPFMRRVEQRVGELLDKRFGEAKSSDAIDSFERQYGQVLYDESGQLKPDGQKFYGAIDRIREAYEDPAKLLALAQELSPLQAPQGQPDAAAAAAAAQAANVQQQQSFLDQAARAAMHSPSAAGTNPPPAQDAGELTQQELDTFFIRAHDTQAAA